jgi:hypothetical protein
MAAPLGGAGRSPTAATTEAEEDVDGGALGVLTDCLAPPKLKKTLMAGPLGGAAGMSASNHHRSPVAATTEVEEVVDGETPRM